MLSKINAIYIDTAGQRFRIPHTNIGHVVNILIELSTIKERLIITKIDMGFTILPLKEQL